MIIVCSQCSTRLQLEDAKIPVRAFTIRCPKCNHNINAQPPAGMADRSAMAVGNSPSTEHLRFERPVPAPAFKLVSDGEETVAEGVESNELLSMMKMLLHRGSPASGKQVSQARPAWDQRRVLVCVTPAHAETIARALTEQGYQVFVAENTTQAVERMREERMDVVILDPEFDPVEQGAAFVTREVNTLRPVERRRLFFMHLNASVRTLDSHAAFLHNVNLVVNPVDIESLPLALERGLREFNELYHELNDAMNLHAI
ncbi:MAG: zinc-ribbon domain-containing protein [Pyrinomonadaceae bacterium]